MNTAHRDMKQLEMADRAERVLELRSERKSWREIAAALDISHETARQDYLAALETARARRLAAAEVQLDEELSVAEALRSAFMPIALTGDEKAASVVLRANAQIQALKGLPQQRPDDTAERVIQLNWNTTTIHYNAPGPQPATITFDPRDADDADIDTSAADPRLLTDGAGAGAGAGADESDPAG